MAFSRFGGTSGAFLIRRGSRAKRSEHGDFALDCTNNVYKYALKSPHFAFMRRIPSYPKALGFLGPFRI